ncbi:hypothetical protein KY290_034193 [Solanum tuberosum]|uniref:Uncharacterized protein n=1 Tax=Solanum tuberosum TaxID=4113 RepID=A0ABQ7U2Y7_SOLTU|nr:hypothetical protein KY289_033576 [Solanum tuberosum]KAH0741150.1 hypothetical protein KY290_034193 [Solanum tuberosum]
MDYLPDVLMDNNIHATNIKIGGGFGGPDSDGGYGGFGGRGEYNDSSGGEYEGLSGGEYGGYDGSKGGDSGGGRQRI